MAPEELTKRFTYHAPKGDQAQRYEQIRAAFRDLAILLDDLCPDSREKSVGFTDLETAVMWFNAAIARNQ